MADIVPDIVPNMSRAEHLACCKQRARVPLKAGELQRALASFERDMNQHVETAKLAQTPWPAAWRRRLTLLALSEALTASDVSRYIEHFL